MATAVDKIFFRNTTENYVFPALRGVQAGREYYVAMCPMRIIPRVFLFDEEELPPNLRSQRILNKARIPEITKYLSENTDSYVLSSMTASIDGEVDFIPHDSMGAASKMGLLVVPMSSRVLINDGQHRRAAIERAIRENRDLGNESISVVFFVDAGLKRSQQMFADLNQNAVRASKSLEILYDHRDDFALLVKYLLETVPVFKNRTELEKTSISNRSTKIFTLSNIYHATRCLFEKSSKSAEASEEDKEFAAEFWTEVSKNMPEWDLLVKNEISSFELRRDYVHVHGVVLQSLGIAGAALVKAHPDDWQKRLKVLREIDWTRANTKLWEGRMMHQGKIRKARTNIILTTNLIKQRLGLSLEEGEKQAEDFLLTVGGEVNNN